MLHLPEFQPGLPTSFGPLQRNLGSQLCTIHNLTYYQSHMRGIREAIELGRLDDFASEFYDTQAAGDPHE